MAGHPPFLAKLYQIVSEQGTEHCIQWTPKGDSFVIREPDSFARDILPTYFKHNNIRSFIRQLNTYGFRKRTNISSSDEHLEFFHPKFRRDEPMMLSQIKRCHQPKAGGAGGSGMHGIPDREQLHRAEIMPMPQSVPSCRGGGAAAATVVGPEIDMIRARVTELKAHLGGLQVRCAATNAPPLSPTACPRRARTECVCCRCLRASRRSASTTSRWSTRSACSCMCSHKTPGPTMARRV
jgi:hypothetical protein